MSQYNTISEIQAKKDLNQIFDSVKRTEYNYFYDYLVKLGTLKILIEVKYSMIKFKSGYIVFQMGQLTKLIKANDFLIYFMSNKGNIFITPKQILNKTHIHQHELNKNSYTALTRIIFENNKLKLIEPENCQRCQGVLKKWLLKN